MSALSENDVVAWMVAAFLLFAPPALVLLALTPPDAGALQTALMGANVLFAWLGGYWLVYLDGLEACRALIGE